MLDTQLLNTIHARLDTTEFLASLEQHLAAGFTFPSPMADERFVKAKAHALIEGTKLVLSLLKQQGN